ncbi:MAG: DUF4347 domain-containing protein, partial [Desulfobacteraceae bacterium]|nr:DUF4347 domain-containing protein [Desulfobacteraceae bacterium]
MKHLMSLFFISFFLIAGFTTESEARTISFSNETLSCGTAKEVVFIDTGVSDYSVLAEGILPGIEVVLLESGKPGVSQMADALENRNDIDAIHIVTHGSEGRLMIAGDELGLENIQPFAPQWRTIGNSLTPDGDILLYGCSVAGGEKGSRFITALAGATGADIAASMDTTGAPLLGADWDLEVSEGKIEERFPFKRTIKNRYGYILPSINFDFDGGVTTGGGTSTVTYKENADPAYLLKIVAAGDTLSVADNALGPDNDTATELVFSLDSGKAFDLTQFSYVAFGDETINIDPNGIDTNRESLTISGMTDASFNPSAPANFQGITSFKISKDDGETFVSGVIDAVVINVASGTAPTVTTQAASAVATTSVTCNGTITDLGSEAVTDHGVCWGTSANPDTNGNKTTEGAAGSTGAFTSDITGLAPDTTYHYRAYATNTAGTSYGADTTFTTVPEPATVTTQAASAVSITSATGNGNITSLGAPNPTEHGVCWNTSANPTIANSKTTKGTAGSTGAFTSDMTGLSPGTTYHYRAYATNSADTVYGADQTFTTLQPPTVTTQAASAVATTSATGNGNITDLGNPAPTQHGVCWSTSANPDTGDSKTTEGAAGSTGAFTSGITGLSPGTTYHYRAYATNSAGTSYGADTTFTTVPEPATVTTQAASAVSTTSATDNNSITYFTAADPSGRGMW